MTKYLFKLYSNYLAGGNRKTLKYLHESFSILSSSCGAYSIILQKLSRLFWIFVTLFLAACSSTIQTKIKDADEIATFNSFKKKLVPAGDFVLTTYQRITDQYSPYVFYIEGDGSITSGRYAISSNPTPSKVMLLKLAALDSRPNIVYIARPCQYTPMELNPKCREDYWVDKRLSDEVIESINAAIIAISNNKPVSLIGFSGGGAAAVLVAARNKNIQDIITIAGNLDIERFSRHHKVYALRASLNPIKYAREINHIPQLHISGEEDLVVPTSLSNAYVASSASPCVHAKSFPGVTHTIGWETIWQSVLTTSLTCKYIAKEI